MSDEKTELLVVTDEFIVVVTPPYSPTKVLTPKTPPTGATATTNEVAENAPRPKNSAAVASEPASEAAPRAKQPSERSSPTGEAALRDVAAAEPHSTEACAASGDLESPTPVGLLRRQTAPTETSEFSTSASDDGQRSSTTGGGTNDGGGRRASQRSIPTGEAALLEKQPHERSGPAGGGGGHLGTRAPNAEALSAWFVAVVGAQAASKNAPVDADVVAPSGMWPRDRIADLIPSLTTDDARLFYMIRDSIREEAPLAHMSAAEVRALIVGYSPLGAALVRKEWDRAVSDVTLQEARAVATAAAAAREAATLDDAARESATRSRASASKAALRETAPSLPPSEPQSEPSVARRPGSRAAPATTSVSESKTARAIPTCAAYPSLSPSPTPSSAAATATIPTKGASASATSARRGLARFDGTFVGIFGFLIVVGLAVGSARRR